MPWMRLLQTTHTLLTPTRYRVDFEAEPLVDLPAGCDAGAYPPTPSDDFPPLNSETTPDGQILYYLRAGLTFPEVPTTPFSGDWHFESLGSGGSPDRPVSASLGNIARYIVVGAGTLTVQTSDPSSGVTGDWFLYHRHEGDADPTLDDSVEAFTIGDPQLIDVSTHDGAECIHWVDFTSNGPGGADGYSIAGASWLSGEGA